jgi:hypothetical protein
LDLGTGAWIGASPQDVRTPRYRGYLFIDLIKVTVFFFLHKRNISRR